MRFSNGRKGVSPPAGFVGGPSITRTRPNDARSNLQGQGPEASPSEANKFRLFTKKKRDTDTVLMSGSVMRFAATPERVRFFGVDRQADTAAFGTTTDDSIIPNGPTVQYFQVGTAGNGYQLSFASGTVNTGSVTDGPGAITTFFYVFGVTTINDFQNRITSSSNFIRIKTPSSSPSDVLNSVALDGGSLFLFGGMTGSDGIFTTSSFTLESSISVGRGFERRKLNQTILGGGPWWIDQQPFPSKIVMETNPTASFESPSWTRKSLGVNHGFVITTLTSSNFERDVLNATVSGFETIESTSAPASSQLYFSKEDRFKKLIVKKTASFFDTVVPFSGILVPTVFLPGTGSVINRVTGSNTPVLLSNFENPATFMIPVNQEGFLTDIKVWVEVVHGTGSEYALGNFGIALRHPTLRWGHAHPIRNDPALIKAYTSDDTDYSSFNGPKKSFYGPNVARFYDSSFLLWESRGVMLGVAQGTSYSNEAQTNGGFDDKRYPTWQRDRSIRTVFCDGAKVPNPRHHYIRGFVSGNNVGAPNSAILLTGSAFGFDVPWTSDKTIFPGNGTYQTPGSPPPGWLTGPANTPAVNEWPTTGSNYGAIEMQPVLPLLDPIFAKKKVFGEEIEPIGRFDLTNSGHPLSQAVFEPDTWRGFRPGLRGAQISGTWELMIVQNSAFGTSASFRQARLEFTYETAPSHKISSLPSRKTAARQGGPRYLFSMSGTDVSNQDPNQFSEAESSGAWDYFTTEIYTDTPNNGEIGRSFGFSMNSGGFVQPNSPALLYRLSGALADIVGQAPDWILDPFTLMPSIPESSASLVTRTSEAVSTPSFSTFLQPRRELDQTQLLSNVASETNPQLKLRDLAASFVSSSAT